MAEKRKSLGKGLSSLLGDDSEDYAELDKVRSSKTVPIEYLKPGKYQPRHNMSEEAIEELAASIKDKGVLQPLLVRRDSEETESYEIIAGERRWRAAQLAQVHDVPVIIKEFTDQEALEIGLVENLQRQDLSPLDEALGYQRLVDEFSHTQEVLSKAVGKSRSHVANMLRLLSLPDGVKTLLDKGDLSAGHARALVGQDNAEALAREIISKGLNVRQTEKLVADAAGRPAKPAKAKAAAPGKDSDTIALENDLSNMLGLKVEINFSGSNGTLTIHYKTLDQLDDVLHRLSHGGGEVSGGETYDMPESLDDIADLDTGDGEGFNPDDELDAFLAETSDDLEGSMADETPATTEDNLVIEEEHELSEEEVRKLLEPDKAPE